MSARGSELDAELSDGDVARAIIAGAGEPAEAALVARFRSRIVLYGRRHLRDHARADDLAQDVLAMTIAKLRAGQVHAPDKIGSFILSAARLMSREEVRREQRANAIAEEAIDVLPRTCDRRVIDGLDGERLASALAALGERERAVIVLAFQNEWSAREIGASLGLAEGNVRVIRHRALARLAELLGIRELEDREEVR
jgi:RNA polymerase sigma-70 factor, ECF subfamily